MEDRTHRIVVGYDGSEPAEAALEWAASEAARRGASLVVVYLMDYSALVGGPTVAAPWLPEASVTLAEQVAQEGAQRAKEIAPGLEVTAMSGTGSPTGGLVEASRSADLLVIGTRGHGDVAGALLGSVAAGVSAHAACPVVVVRGQADLLPGPTRAVVVGVDGSAPSAAALEFATETALAHRAPLTVVCAWTPVALDRWGRSYWLAVDPNTDPDTSARDAAERVASAAVAAARSHAAELLGQAGPTADGAPALPADSGPELDVTAYLGEGRPAPVILAAAKDAGLIVVGARGRGSFASLLLGSVSHGVVHHAPCPVAVIRRPAHH